MRSETRWPVGGLGPRAAGPAARRHGARPGRRAGRAGVVIELLRPGSLHARPARPQEHRGHGTRSSSRRARRSSCCAAASTCRWAAPSASRRPSRRPAGDGRRRCHGWSSPAAARPRHRRRQRRHHLGAPRSSRSSSRSRCGRSSRASPCSCCHPSARPCRRAGRGRRRDLLDVVPVAFVLLLVLLGWWMWFRGTRLRQRHPGSRLQRASGVPRRGVAPAEQPRGVRAVGALRRARRRCSSPPRPGRRPPVVGTHVLPSIAAVVIGGTSLAGGRGGLVGHGDRGDHPQPHRRCRVPAVSCPLLAAGGVRTDPGRASSSPAPLLADRRSTHAAHGRRRSHEPGTARRGCARRARSSSRTLAAARPVRARQSLSRPASPTRPRRARSSSSPRSPASWPSARRWSSSAAASTCRCRGRSTALAVL